MPTILVVDDEQEFANTYTQFIKHFMKVQDVYGAHCSADALKIIKEKSPDLLVVDYNLQESMNGLDVYKAAKERNPNVIACLVTGNIDAATEEKARACGIKVILEKPIPLTPFKEALEKLIAECDVRS